MLCWLQFCDEDGHDEDLTGDVWLADYGGQREMLGTHLHQDFSILKQTFIDILININRLHLLLPIHRRSRRSEHHFSVQDLTVQKIFSFSRNSPRLYGFSKHASIFNAHLLKTESGLDNYKPSSFSYFMTGYPRARQPKRHPGHAS